MEDDLDGFDVGGEDDEFADTAIEGFGGFVGSVGMKVVLAQRGWGLNKEVVDKMTIMARQSVRL